MLFDDPPDGSPVGQAARGHLEASLAPDRPLGDVNGVTLVLARVEIWTTWLVVRLEVVENELTRALDAEFDSAWEIYQARWRAHRRGAELTEEELQPPEQPSVARLSALPLSVADDVGTQYHSHRSAIGGSEHRWRSEWRFEPGVSESAASLRVALEGNDRSAAECLELALPAHT